jgi:hypothetical protein
VIPSGSDDPFVRLKFFQPHAHSLLDFADRGRSSQIHLELDVGAAGKVDMGIIEPGHRELAMQIDDASFGAEPRFHFRIRIRGGDRND